MTALGMQIGKKFREDGTPMPYPGNTVISDISASSPAWAALDQLRGMLKVSDLAGCYILLPEDSYHMTVIRGLNDQVRGSLYWPPALSTKATLAQADAFIKDAVLRVPKPGPVMMRFLAARVNEEDFRVLLAPADETQGAALRSYRDHVAASLGLFLPGHEAYTFHITLAYTRRLPEDRQKQALERMVRDMNTLLKEQPPFETGAPYLAFYQDMTSFLPARR